MRQFSVVFIYLFFCGTYPISSTWGNLQFQPVPTPWCWIQLVSLCYLPATTIFSSLPFRARSLLGSSVLCAIESAAAISDTKTRRRKQEWVRLCVMCLGEHLWKWQSLPGCLNNATLLHFRWGREREGGTAAKTPSIWIFIVRGQRRAQHIN